jgi:hypothetical protein
MSGHDGLISKLVDLGKSDTGMRSTTAVKAQVFIEQAMRLVVTLVIKIIIRSFRRFVVTRPIQFHSFRFLVRLITRMLSDKWMVGWRMDVKNTYSQTFSVLLFGAKPEHLKWMMIRAPRIPPLRI